jgi:curved DNA-binding protein CbpA
MYPFFVLGVDHDATDEQVAARYHELVRQYPPDRAPEKFTAIRAAYEALRDERSRLDTQLFYFDRTGRSLAEANVWENDEGERKRLDGAAQQAILAEIGRSPDVLDMLLEPEADEK